MNNKYDDAKNTESGVLRNRKSGVITEKRKQVSMTASKTGITDSLSDKMLGDNINTRRSKAKRGAHFKLFKLQPPGRLGLHFPGKALKLKCRLSAAERGFGGR